ncbi:multiple inositol polyphosphate phosphatase 1 [Calliopsis andreniformis]|uniref:multiple inositol polyphosphate phosphatase 1 n=1 Tax=Calliopsis andreniformis TaxID=337506 RepID=UPI003FCDD3C2
MQRMWSVQVFIILSLTIMVCFVQNCLLPNADYKCRLGTKTPYRLIANYDDSPPEYMGCAPKKIWMVIRHGTRYPGKKYISSLIEKLPKLQEIILENYQQNKADITDDIASLLVKWNLTFTEDDIMKLAEEGENEMIDLAERYQSRFPSLIPEIYDNQTFKFKYTATQRTKESARNFATGLFGRFNSQKVQYPEAEHRDPVLRFYKNCSRWRVEVDKNPDALIEKQKFLKSKNYTKMLENVSKRIGHQIDHETASLMHTMCGFETAWHVDVESPWCKMFSLDDFKVLEYAEDLEKYWIDGYGYKLNYEQACPALRDMFDFFALDKGPSVSAYFTHSGTILKLIASLGVSRDDQHLMHDLFSEYADERAWRTGIIDAFASNIGFVLYNCTSGGPSILFMHQERPLNLPGCPSDIPCPLSIMKALYPDEEEECQFHAMCFNEKNT